MGDQHAEKIGNNDSASNNPGQDGEAPGPSNPPSQDEEIIDGEAQARFMERALAESARLRREADRFNDRRDEGRNTMAGGAARMTQLLAEHNEENFGGSQSASNPTAVEKQ